MTPTLTGRWQTRLFLLFTLGLPITACFAWLLGSSIPFVLLWWTLIFGFGWDALYNQIQRGRWDSDWPPTLQLAGGIAELLWLFVLVYILRLIAPPPFAAFLAHYITVWVAVFLASQSVMRILFPRWRFRGGQLL